MKREAGMIVLNTVLLAAFVSYVALKLAPKPICNPFLLVWPAWLGVAVVTCTLARSRRLRVVAANGGSVAVILLGAEWLAIRIEARQTGSGHGQVSIEHHVADDRPLIVPDPLLGGRLNSDLVVHVKYDLPGASLRPVYTTDHHGLRITPSAVSDAQVVLAVGCSYTFGQGVADNETYPYVLGERLYPRFQVYNFGCMGYGVHHLYALVQSGVLTNVMGGRTPSYIVYLAIPDHIRRALGAYDYTLHSPCYLLDDGKPIYAGEHWDVRARQTVRNQLRKSHLYGLVSKAWRARPLSRENLELLAALVTQSRRELLQRWPKLQFIVLFWDYGPQAREQLAALQNVGIDVIPVSRVLPELGRHPERYALGPGDYHPNSLAYRMIGDYLARLISDHDRQPEL